MEKLFENKTPYTYEEYLKLNKFHFSKSKKVYNILIIACIILIYSISIFMLIVGSKILEPILYIIFATALGGIIKVIPYVATKSITKTDSFINNVTNDEVFYDEYLINKTEQSELKVLYNQVFKAYETKTHFYIYVNKRAAMIVNKENFILGNVDEFRKFLNNKLDNKFISKYKL